MPNEQILKDAVNQRNAFITAKITLKDQLRKELERQMETSLSALQSAYELAIVRAKEDGWPISKIAHSMGMKGTKFVYDILDSHSDDWRITTRMADVEITVPVAKDAPEAPKNFRFKEDWAFIDLYFPGVADVPGGYYTYRVEDRRDPHFETASVQTAIELEKIPGKGVDYWEANAYNAIVTIGKGQDYAEFKRVHMDPKGLTEDMIRAGWEKAND